MNVKKITLSVLLLLTAGIVYAQTVSKPPISYGRDYLYTSDIETDPCAGAQLSLNVKRSHRGISCTIIIDGEKIHGYLVRNTDHSNAAFANLYNFYRISNTKNIVLLVKFYLDGNTYKVDIINEKWIQILKPCFDNKVITLQIPVMLKFTSFKF